jgi:hypothetical protein
MPTEDQLSRQDLRDFYLSSAIAGHAPKTFLEMIEKKIVSWVTGMMRSLRADGHELRRDADSGQFSTRG